MESEVFQPTSSADVQKALEKMNSSRIFFAHKSVGDNILTGLERLAEQNGIELKTIKLSSETPLTHYSFAHSTEGANGNPRSKVDAFYSKLQQLNGEFAPQIAFMKFCFVDVTADTDVEQLFTYYKQMIERLEAERPEINLIHLTVPLTARSYNFKDRIKRLISLPTWNDAANIKRAEYNRLLRAYFPPESVFDIALIESISPDGERERFFNHGKAYYAMSPLYTNDGGHLNRLGQDTVASELTLFLANALSRTHQN